VTPTHALPAAGRVAGKSPRMRHAAWLLGILPAGILFATISSAPEPPRTLHVNREDPTCRGQAPCYPTIQAAVDAAEPGDTVRIQAGAYPEQVSIRGKNVFADAGEPDRILIEADPAAAAGSVVITGASAQCSDGFAVRFQESKFVTLRGVAIASAGDPVTALLGGDQNEANHIERIRLVGHGRPECNRGAPPTPRDPKLRGS